MSHPETSFPLGVDAETWAFLCTDRLVPQSQAHGGVCNARRVDGSWVRGVVWAACALLADEFDNGRELEAAVEETFKRTRNEPPVFVERGEYDPEALAAAHRAEAQGEQLAL